jgi:DNA end-binding protein Ku
VLSVEDFDKVRPQSTRVIDLVQFTDDSAIDPMYVDRTYYLAPDGKIGADAFAVMREGMKGKVGIGKLALYGREYLVAVRPQGRGIVMHTLHHAAELRSIDTVEELNSVPGTVKPDEMKLAKQVIETFEGRSIWRTTRTNIGKACSGSSTRRLPAKKSWRHRSKSHRGLST